MMSRSLIVLTLGFIAVAAGPAAALEASGQAVAVVADTSASGPGGDRALATQGPVFTGDVIKTDRRGTAQLLFADQTRMVIGPQSQVTIDKFVFGGPAKASTFAIDAVRGSFRFITGASAKNAYSISTPTATIGVRGTAFDGHIGKDGTTTIAMWHGAVRLCDKAEPRQHCTEISGTCSMIQVPPDKDFNRVNNVYERTAILDENVPFAFRQTGLQTAFRVASGSCEIHNVDPYTNPNSHEPAPPPPRPQED